MSEQNKIICDFCYADISSCHQYPIFRVKLSEEAREPIKPINNIEGHPEFGGKPMHFCDSTHLKSWLLELNQVGEM